MTTQKDVREIAMKLPGAIEERPGFAFSVENQGKVKGFVWSWKERIDPKKARVPREDVIAIRVAGLDDKAALLAGDPEKFFTEPHYNGYPAVLVRLPMVTKTELKALLVEAWRCMAPAEASPSGGRTPPRGSRPSARRPSGSRRKPSRRG